MTNPRSMHPALWLLMTLVLSACGRESTAPSAAADRNTAREAPSTTPSPAPWMPTGATMLEQQLVDLGAKQTDRGLLIVLSSAQFSPGQTTFEPEVLTRLERLAGLLRARPELQARVIGHTDSSGSTALNARLSLERAQAVQQALIEREHIDSQRIDVQGAGESTPLASNATAAGRAQNRRVEILVTDSAGRYASSTLPPPRG